MPYKVDGVWYNLNTSQPYYPYNTLLTLTLWGYTTGSVDDYRGNHKVLANNTWSSLKVT